MLKSLVNYQLEFIDVLIEKIESNPTLKSGLTEAEKVAIINSNCRPAKFELSDEQIHYILEKI